ncbi:hypothetical protein ACFYKT_00045 [Cytobacillus sp. FJAT-53684]|uniref:Uncharacterized protein n=1 Tax=Cytobacillus mangrovibacter TaxID=3299024 RepID=A0ABW6JVC7_9BACI
MDDNIKEKIKTWLLVVLIVTLIGSIVFIILGFYKLGFALGGIFMFLASLLAEWSRDKSAVYLHRKNYENKYKKYH